MINSKQPQHLFGYPPRSETICLSCKVISEPFQSECCWLCVMTGDADEYHKKSNKAYHPVRRKDTLSEQDAGYWANAMKALEDSVNLPASIDDAS